MTCSIYVGRVLPLARGYEYIAGTDTGSADGNEARDRRPDLQPLASRIRQRLVMAPAEPDDLARLLDHLLEEAGNPGLMTQGLRDALCAHAAGNPRTLTVMADTLLAAAAEQDREVLDEKLFIETWGEPTQPRRARR